GYIRATVAGHPPPRDRGGPGAEHGGRHEPERPGQPTARRQEDAPHSPAGQLRGSAGELRSGGPERPGGAVPARAVASVPSILFRDGDLPRALGGKRVAEPRRL